MNLVDCFVTKVKSAPYQIDPPKYWFVDVEYDCYGRMSETAVMVKTLEDAEKIDVGYVFQG